MLNEAANAKEALFRQEIEKDLKDASEGRNREVPPGRSINFESDVSAHAYKATALTAVLKSLFNKYSQRTAPSYQRSALNASRIVVTRLIGRSSRQVVRTVRIYQVIPHGNSISRFDFRAWNYKVQSEKLQDKVGQVTVYVAAKHLVDTTKIDAEECLSIYQDVLQQLTTSERNRAIRDFNKYFKNPPKIQKLQQEN